MDHQPASRDDQAAVRPACELCYGTFDLACVTGIDRIDGLDRT
jgi:hypothetical protein